jgi:hypothetical protein
MTITQDAVSIRATILPDERSALDAALARVNADIEANPIVPFAALPGVHFARFLILDDAEVNGQLVPASLVYAANIDGDWFAHLDSLAALGAGLDEVWQHCDGYPPPEVRTRATRRAFLRQHRIKSHALYVNTVGRTVEQARAEAGLREKLEDTIDGLHRANGNRLRSRADVARALRDAIGREESTVWALQDAQARSALWRFKERVLLAVTILALVILSPIVILVAVPWLLVLRSHEKRDAKQPVLRLTAFRRGRLPIAEDQVVQNQFSAVGCIKPFWIRRASVRVLLLAADFVTKHYFNKGDLGTFRPLGLNGVDTIHFAQWLVIDEGHRVLFLSNYDGSLTSYMDDFINKVAWGLNAVFSHGEFYPPTRWLVLDGATDEQAFKAFLQKHQIPTQAWYSAHKHLSALNLGNNEAIRAGLASAGAGSSQWTERL